MKSRLLLLALSALLFAQTSVSAQSAEEFIEPIAHTPDAETVLQTSLSQSDYPEAPIFMVFTEYTFGDEQLAVNYFYGICSFLEADMQETWKTNYRIQDVPQDVNPQCGYANLKGTQALNAVVHEDRVLTIWSFGMGINSEVGDFMEGFMDISTPMTDDAVLPVAEDVERPWKVDSADVDVTEYAKTAIDLREKP